MKLNYKKTMLVGLAFFTITIFWQAYDSVISRILIDKFGLSQTVSGVVMAIDNVLAIFLLPLFGAISDRASYKRGKRTPYILVGTIVAAIAFMGLTLTDNFQMKQIRNSDAKIEEYFELAINNVDESDRYTYEHWNYVLNDVLAGQTSREITSLSELMVDENGNLKTGKMSVSVQVDVKEHFFNHLNLQAREVTKANPLPLILFGGLLLIALVAMSIFRSPAVALMPDVTIKPLRSKANAIINLMGSLGASLAFLLIMITGRDFFLYKSYGVIFIPVAIIMLIGLLVFMLTVKEVEWVKEKLLEDAEFGLTEEDEVEEKGEKAVLSKEKKTALILILSSVFLWYMGYNAVISKVSDYAPKVLNMGSSLAALVANIVAIIMFIPIGILSSKIGRKRAILIGVVILTGAFGSVYFLNENTGKLMYVVFGLVGIGWAMINVNSYPMVVELAKGSDVGKFTGYYYTFSMAAQIVTPMLSGFLMDNMGRKVLFPYAALFVAFAFITMLFVKAELTEIVPKKSLLEHLDIED